MRPRIASRYYLVLAASVSANTLTSHAAYAQQPLELPGIVVSTPGSGSTAKTAPADVVVSPTAIVTPSNETASSVTVITAKQIEQEQRRSVPDVLRTVPGLNVVQTGGPGGLTSVFMRGTNSNHVKVLIDGIEVSDTANRSFDFGQLSTFDIERIEVLRGPQSGLYGADALGGVISIITKKGEGPPRMTGFVEGGSFGTFNQGAGASGSEGRFNYAFNVSHLRSMDTPVTPLDLLFPGTKRINDSYDNLTLSTRLGYDITQNLTVNFVARYTDADLAFTSDESNCLAVAPFNCFPNAKHSFQHVEQFFTRGEIVWSPFGEAFKNYFSVAYGDQSNASTSPVTGLNKFSGERIKTDWRGVANVAPGTILMFGLEHQNESLDTATTHAEESNSAGYIELQTQVAKRFFLAANIRYDDNENFGGHTTWRVAPAFVVPGTDTKLKASIGTGFKAPSLTQRFVDFPFFDFFANPNLKPEESLGWEVGFEQPFMNDRFRVGVTYFHNDITNLIQGTFDPITFISSVDNIGQATTSGVEVFARWSVTDRFGLRADYTYTEAQNDDTGQQLLRRPKHKGSLTTTWKATDALLLSGTVILAGPYLDRDRFFSQPPFQTDGYALVNLAAEYRINDNVTIFGRADNLFDAHYQDPTGFERPGLGIFAGVRLTNR